MVQAEPVFEGSRLDFLLQAPSLPPLLIEAKSSTHAENDTAFFPRAVTQRGSRHLHSLMQAINQGYRAAIVFIIQRADAKIFRPNDRIDPKFGKTLRQAIKHGVEAYAWTTQLDENTMQINIDHAIPVDLDPPLSS
jgi:sugar fermentation stimulation protein A